eukprot:scaffold65489_cov20-Tisochrysis_lutea.AAC.1
MAWLSLLAMAHLKFERSANGISEMQEQHWRPALCFSSVQSKMGAKCQIQCTKTNGNQILQPKHPYPLSCTDL